MSTEPSAVSSPLQPARALPARPAARSARLPRVSDRSRLQISHLPQHEDPWPVLGLRPEDHQARRAVLQHALLTHTHKAGVYTQWGLALEARSLSAALGFAEGQAAFGIASVAALLFDGYSVIKDARSARHDYLMGSILLHQALALRHALRQRARDTARSAPAQELEQLDFTIAALETMLANFETAYYPRRQLPYMAQIRAQIEQSACAIADDLLRFDRLAGERLALAHDLDRRVDPAERAALGARIEALTRELGGLEAGLQPRLLDVDRLLSRRRLRRSAKAQYRQLRAQRGADAADELAELQRQIDAFKRPWREAAFSPYQGMGHAETKRFRDAALQLPKAAVDASSTALTIASLAAHLIGTAFGGYGLTALSSLFSLYIARGENKDGKREQRRASAAKEATWSRLCLAAQARERGALLEDPRGRALYRAVCGAFIVRQERALAALHRATRQAQTRRTKGELSYLVNALAVVGGAIALGTGGAALPFMGIPAALVGGPYLVSVGWHALERKRDKDRDKALAAVAQAFVRCFGIDAILDFYTDMDSRDPARLRAWQQRLQQLLHAWYGADDFTNPLIDEVQQFRDIDPDELGCARLLDNDFLALNLLGELLHRHARGRRQGQGQGSAAAQLLGELGMSADTLKHLLQHHGAFETPARHRASARQLVAAFMGLRLFPDHRLPAHVRGSPRHIVRRVDALLHGALRPLAHAPAVLGLLEAMHAQPSRGIALLTLAPPEVLAALRAWMQAVRESLHQGFVGPVELFALQQALLEAGDATARQRLDRRGLTLLDQPIGPLCLELLADPGTLHTSVALRLPPPPAVRQAGPALLARLLAAMKSAGRRLRDHERGTHRRLSASAQRASGRLDPERWRLRHTSAALVRELQLSAWRQTHSVSKRLRQTGPNPLATPARTLALLRREHRPEQRVDLCARILLEFLHLSDAPPGSPGLDPEDLLERSLRAVEVVAEDSAAGVQAEHRRRASELGAGPLPERHRQLIERLRATARLSRLLRQSLQTQALCERLRGPAPER
ncbi:MAG: hypothetical protein IBJ04_19430 [Hydrogenophaga sp.]|nr:hypothetical protein [Hydrogenophaga sp.]